MKLINPTGEQVSYRLTEIVNRTGAIFKLGVVSEVPSIYCSVCKRTAKYNPGKSVHGKVFLFADCCGIIIECNITGTASKHTIPELLMEEEFVPVGQEEKKEVAHIIEYEADGKKFYGLHVIGTNLWKDADLEFKVLHPW